MREGTPGSRPRVTARRRRRRRDRRGGPALRRAFAVLVAGLGLATADVGCGAEDVAVTLPEPRTEGRVAVEAALARRRSVREYSRDPLDLAAVSQLLWAAQGVTDPDGRRTAPSAGALYPLEIYLVAGAVTNLAAGIYHYDSRRHEIALTAPRDARREAMEAALEQDWIAEAPVILVFTAVPDRTARKYGSRAQRYIAMEVGHAAENVYLQASASGLGTCVVGAFRDEALKRALDLPDEVLVLALMPAGHPR